jgi:hypothetical protein
MSDAAELFGLQRRGGRELGHRGDGPQVREQAKGLADSEQALLGPLRHLDRVPFRASDRAEKDSGRRLASRDRRGGRGLPAAS